MGSRMLRMEILGRRTRGRRVDMDVVRERMKEADVGQEDAVDRVRWKL